MVYMMLADGFETIEALAPLDILRRGSVEICTVGVYGSEVTSSHGVCLKADILIGQMKKEEMELLILPGGPGVERLRDSAEVLETAKYAYDNERLLGAICAAPAILAELGMLRGRRAVCFPSYNPQLQRLGAKIQTDTGVTHDRNIVTALSAGYSVEFGLKLLAMLRGWEASEKVRKEIHYRDECALT